MKNQYFGDKHDFYKYYFLKNIFNDWEYSLGIHWCLTPDDNTKHGITKITPVEEKKDKELFSILSKEHNIEAIKPYFKKNTKYYSELLKEYYNEHSYEQNAIEQLSTQDIIFFDPDNGLEILSTNNKNKYKYVSYKLLKRFWDINKSLIIYQHGDRIKNSINEKIKLLRGMLKNIDNINIIIKNNVYYICVINNEQGDLNDIIPKFANINTNGYKFYVNEI